MTFSIMRNIQRGEWHGSIEELLQTACKNEENTCMVEGLESSAEEWGFEAYAMSNGFHCAAMDRQSLRALSEDRNTGKGWNRKYPWPGWFQEYL